MVAVKVRCAAITLFTAHACSLMYVECVPSATRFMIGERGCIAFEYGQSQLFLYAVTFGCNCVYEMDSRLEGIRAREFRFVLFIKAEGRSGTESHFLEDKNGILTVLSTKKKDG